MPRKTTPKVRDGRVHKKNRHARTPSYWNTPQRVPVVDKERPGKGYRHVLRKQDIHDFISIVPDWEQLSKGLNAVVLASDDFDGSGWDSDGVVGICAWGRDIETDWDLNFFDEHRALLDRLGVPWENKSKWVLGHFTESTVRAYQLVHIFLHELGHHHDHMRNYPEGSSSHEESYAERYALKYEAIILDRYCETFDLY